MELFTWESLTTMAAASTLTFLIVGNTKDLPGIKQIRTFLWAVIVSTIILCIANLAIGGNPLDWRLYVLCFFNAWMVAAATGKMSDSAKEKVG